MRHTILALPDQTAVQQLQILLASYLSRQDNLFTFQHLEVIPALPQIMKKKGFTQALKNFDQTLSDFMEMDRELQKFILRRYLHEISQAADCNQEAALYKQTMSIFQRYNINAATYLSGLTDKDEMETARTLFKRGAAAYAQKQLEVEFESARLAVDDMHIVQSEDAAPNDRLESLLRPFTDAVKYNEIQRTYSKPKWFELLGVLEEAGWDFSDPGLVKAIQPANAFINTMMDFPNEEQSPSPA